MVGRLDGIIRPADWSLLLYAPGYKKDLVPSRDSILS
jgi:hypothetical protein